MNVVVENLPNCITTLRVELEPSQVAQEWNAVTNEITRQARIPGYRPGKAPKEIVEKKYKKEIREELEKKLLSQACREVIKEQNIRVLSLSQIDDVELADDKSMKFTATVVTQPAFDLPVYKALPITAKSSEVTEAEIQRTLETVREQAAEFKPVPAERGAELGDFVVVDYRGTIDGQSVSERFPKAGAPLSGNQNFWIQMTPEAFFPGFATELSGAKPGETRNFEITVPADFPVEGLPGQKIAYEVTLREVNTKILPDVDDAFASTVIEGKTLADLKEVLRDELARQKARNVVADQREQIMKKLLAGVECELPIDLVRQETRRILNEILRENQARGVSDEVLKESEQKLVGSAAQGAREKLKGTFILLRIAEAEGIRVERAEFLGRLNAGAEQYQTTPEKLLKELEKRGSLARFEEEILTGKVLDFLVTEASVTPVSEEPAPALEEGSLPTENPSVKDTPVTAS